jgi:hypothetical protein
MKRKRQVILETELKFVMKKIKKKKVEEEKEEKEENE